MLTLLKIKNLALVDALTWNIGTGLVGVTGETGAGKSVIVGALKLILGERADKGLIRTGEASCSVEAVFEIARESEVWPILENAGVEVECEDGLIIKRVFGSGSNKQFVNNSPVTLAVLRNIGEFLVDLHGPHDHQGLLSNDRQLSMLDAFAGLESNVSEYRRAFAKWSAKQDELDALIAADRAGDQEIELLRYQVEEIDAANINPAEESEVEEFYKKASNGSRISELATQIGGILSGGLNAQLGDVQRAARELERLDTSASDLLGGLDGAVMELQELEVTIADYLAQVDVDPAEVMRLEERINTFETLKRKYGPSLEDVLQHADQARARLETFENRDAVIEQLAAEARAALRDVEKVAAKLSSGRKKMAPKLAKEISTHLKDLGFKQAEFGLDMETYSKPRACGMETVDFQFGPNPGEPLKPLKSIASSGEISRVMLAVKSALADQDATPLMVFDEIDANVGGEIARAVGKKMATLGAKHQVVSITHFPQVAAVANQHFVVTKLVEDGRACSSLREVADEARVDELVRMLGGGDGKEAREMALTLLAK